WSLVSSLVDVVLVITLGERRREARVRDVPRGHRGLLRLGGAPRRPEVAAVAHGAMPPIGAAPPGDIWSLTALTSSAWSTRPEVVAPLLIVAGAYAVGWWRLRRRGGSVPGWHVAASAGGLLTLSLALSAPFQQLAPASFAAHMAQHLLLVRCPAPLLLLADPFAALVWAIPSPMRAGVGRWLRPGAPLRRLWQGLTLMSVAWLAHSAAMWLWHLPTAYDAAVADRALHDLEHLVFFGT